MFKEAYWIKPHYDYKDVCPVFIRKFDVKARVQKAVLCISAMGVYEAEINGKRVGNFIMAPGWTSYHKRHQYQEYDVTDLILFDENKDRTENKAVTADAFCIIRCALGFRCHSSQKTRCVAVNTQGCKREYNADRKKSDEYDRQCGFQFSVYVAPRQTVKQRPQYVRKIFAEHFR